MRLNVPVTPDPDTARRWAEDELAKGIYHEGESLLERVGRELSDAFYKLLARSEGGSLSPLGMLVGALVLVAVLVIAARIAAPAIKQRARRQGAVMDADDLRTAAQMRREALDAKSAGNHGLAALDAFRAIVRGCEERVVIDERPGRTAREASRDIGVALPGAASELLHAHVVFDQVCYGHRDASEEDAAAMIALEARVSSMRPVVVAA